MQARAKPRSASALVPWVFTAMLAAVVGLGLYALTRGPHQVAAAANPSAALAAARDTRLTAGPGARIAMPTTDPPGWHQVFAEDFNGPLDLSRWRVYSGQPGGDPAAWFDPRHVSVSGGKLVISGYRDPGDRGRWATGGVSTIPGLVQTYGKYLVRLRMDSGTGIGHAVLLTPANGSWPPEVDFSEDNGAGRARTQVTLHYGPRNSLIFKATRVNLTRWHTLGVEWLPRVLRFTLDGRVWYTITGNGVPAVPMALAIQSQTWPCAGTWGRCPDTGTPRTVNMDVDWVVAYAPNRL